MAARKDKLSALLELVETYRGRDKIVRLLSYVLQLLSSSARRYKYLKFERFCSVLSQEFSNLRVLTRLFDDMAMFQWSFGYGLGKKSDDNICRVFQVIQNLVDQCYYPVEHIAWARDVGILRGRSEHLWHFGCALWLISLCMALMMSIRKILLLREKELALKKEVIQKQCSQLENENNQSCNQLPEQLMELKRKHKYLLIDICEYSVDMINAIHWLPGGFLWASKLPEGIVGSLGTVSSLCQLFKTIYPLNNGITSNKNN